MPDLWVYMDLLHLRRRGPLVEFRRLTLVCLTHGFIVVPFRGDVTGAAAVVDTGAVLVSLSW